jgi:hypothetical protein
MPAPIPRAAVEARRRLAIEHDDIVGDFEMNDVVHRRMRAPALAKAPVVRLV